MKYYWEIIADNLKKDGWSLGYVSAIDSQGRLTACQAKALHGNQVTPAPVGRTTGARWRDGGRRVNGTVLIAVLPVG